LAIQTKLASSGPGDEYEREADRVSEQVMRMPDPRLQRSCPCGGSCPACQAAPAGHRHEPLHPQQSFADARGAPDVPALVHEVLHSPGEPIDRATRSFMEPRFGHDFSRVRVHHDRRAAESARSIGALAYASGDHIAFDDGQYSPATQRRKELLAHELAHTLQKRHVLHRKIAYTARDPVLLDPIPLVLSGNTKLGKTFPGLNGNLIPEGATPREAKVAVFNAIQPTITTSPAADSSKTCKVDNAKYNIDVFALVKAITQPQGSKWSGAYAPGVMNNPPQVCSARRGQDRIRVELTGKPDSAALHRKVLTHEGEHATDLKNLMTSELKPIHDTLIRLTGKGATDEACRTDMLRPVGNKDALAAQSFIDKWLAAVQVYDKPTGTHHSKFATNVNADCTKAQITER
jgi:hypothetical protein